MSAVPRLRAALCRGVGLTRWHCRTAGQRLGGLRQPEGPGGGFVCAGAAAPVMHGRVRVKSEQLTPSLGTDGDVSGSREWVSISPN